MILSNAITGAPVPEPLKLAPLPGSRADGNGAAASVPFITLPRLRRSALPPVGRGGGLSALATTSDPVAGADYVPVAAMEDVLALRQQQIHKFGHTAAADLAAIAASGKRYHVAALASCCLRDAIEDMQFNKEAAQIRRRLVKAAALTLAAIDAEDARAAQEDEEDPFDVE